MLRTGRISYPRISIGALKMLDLPLVRFGSASLSKVVIPFGAGLAFYELGVASHFGFPNVALGHRLGTWNMDIWGGVAAGGLMFGIDRLVLTRIPDVLTNRAAKIIVNDLHTPNDVFDSGKEDLSRYLTALERDHCRVFDLIDTSIIGQLISQYTENGYKDSVAYQRYCGLIGRREGPTTFLFNASHFLARDVFSTQSPKVTGQNIIDLMSSTDSANRMTGLQHFIFGYLTPEQSLSFLSRQLRVLLDRYSGNNQIATVEVPLRHVQEQIDRLINTVPQLFGTGSKPDDFIVETISSLQALLRKNIASQTMDLTDVRELFQKVFDLGQQKLSPAIPIELKRDDLDVIRKRIEQIPEITDPEFRKFILECCDLLEKEFSTGTGEATETTAAAPTAGARKGKK